MNSSRESLAAAVDDVDGGAILRVKVVPGARRDRVAGMLGDRLKIAVSAPPEGGKANKAVCRMLAARLGVAMRAVTVAAGTTQPMKSIAIAGLSAAEVTGRLANSVS